ncbi:MAG: methionyl-tRNA formyltransferase, partial [Firmicutes bacterium]|nr:methionyl-tRNA formyltransferase [Bacillota bacterium]
AGEVAERLASAGAALLVRAVGEIASGEARRLPQDHARATYAPPLRREEEQINWTDEALSLYNLIRGLNPRPGAYTTFRGRRLKIWRAALPAAAGGGIKETGNASVSLPEDALPGTVLAHEGRLLVAAGKGGILELLEVQPAGKRPISGGDFYRGYRLGAGARLGE